MDPQKHTAFSEDMVAREEERAKREDSPLTVEEADRLRGHFLEREAGRMATEAALSDPIMTLYNYTREQRSPKKHKYIWVPVGRYMRRRPSVI